MRARAFVVAVLAFATLIPTTAIAHRALRGGGSDDPALQAAQAPSGNDLLVGSWVLDIPSSRYRPGPGPLAETRVYTREPDGVKGVIKRTHPDGQVETIEYMAETDREYMVTGTPQYDSVKLKQYGPRSWEAQLMHGGTIFGTARREISHDGKTMRITFTRPDLDVLNIAVYDKK